MICLLFFFFFLPRIDLRFVYLFLFSFSQLLYVLAAEGKAKETQDRRSFKAVLRCAQLAGIPNEALQWFTGQLWDLVCHCLCSLGRGSSDSCFTSHALLGSTRSLFFWLSHFYRSVGVSCALLRGREVMDTQLHTVMGTGLCRGMEVEVPFQALGEEMHLPAAALLVLPQPRWCSSSMLQRGCAWSCLSCPSQPVSCSVL